MLEIWFAGENEAAAADRKRLRVELGPIGSEPNPWPSIGISRQPFDWAPCVKKAPHSRGLRFFPQNGFDQNARETASLKFRPGAGPVSHVAGV